MVCGAAAAASAASPKAQVKAPEEFAVSTITATRHVDADASRSLLSGLPAVPGLAGSAGVTTSGGIFYDGFEGASSPWGLLGDEPTWAMTEYRKAAGSRSAYCAGGGILPPGPYANNMNTWMFAGPFDLSQVSSATFDYQLYYKTEVEVDIVAAMVSVDGENWNGTGESGDSQGWIARSMDLTAVPYLGNVCGHSQVYIAFFFRSDSSITYEGAYVDEVRITGGGGGGGTTAALDLQADPMTVPYRGTVTIEASLRDASSGSLIPNQDIEWLYSQDDNIQRDWIDGGPASSTTGEYTLRLSPIERRTYFVLYFGGDGQYEETLSDFVKIMSRAKLTPPAVPSRVRAGVKIKSWGTLKPLHTADQNKASHTRVDVERYSSGQWRRVVSLFAQDYRNTSSMTKYCVGLRYAPGKWRIRAVHEDSDHAKTTSSWRNFTAS